MYSGAAAARNRSHAIVGTCDFRPGFQRVRGTEAAAIKRVVRRAEASMEYANCRTHASPTRRYRLNQAWLQMRAR